MERMVHLSKLEDALIAKIYKASRQAGEGGETKTQTHPTQGSATTAISTQRKFSDVEEEKISDKEVEEPPQKRRRLKKIQLE